jgi:hypothetical protein
LALKKKVYKENIFDRATRWVNSFEDSFVNFVSVIIPWLVPLIPAYILYTHLMTDLKWDRPWPLIAGTVVEGLGLATVNTYFRFERHNRKYKDQKNKMPLWVVIVAYVWYLAIVLFVNVVFDWRAGVDFTRIIAILSFSTLSLPASALISVRGMHSEWKSEHERKYSKEQPATSQLEPISQPKEPIPASYVCGVAGCTAKPFGSQSALNAHQRSHKLIQANGASK